MVWFHFKHTQGEFYQYYTDNHKPYFSYNLFILSVIISQIFICFIILFSLKPPVVICLFIYFSLVPRVLLEQPWLSQVIPRFWLVDDFYTELQRTLKNRRDANSVSPISTVPPLKRSTVKILWLVQFLVDLWLHNQPWFNHGLFTWIIHDSAKTCSKLSQIHKARLRHLSQQNSQQLPLLAWCSCMHMVWCEIS